MIMTISGVKPRRFLRRRTSLSEAAFLGISFNITATITFKKKKLQKFKDMTVFYNY